MKPTITAFKGPPDNGEGQARDMRVRWALEEVRQPYNVRSIAWEEFKQPEHVAIHPFAQIPTYEEGDLVLFESGSIVLHIGETHKGLLPDDADARARAITWIFAALNTVEPPIVEREQLMLFERDKPWYEQRLQLCDDAVRKRLRDLSNRLGDGAWLEGDFCAGDLMMVMVLRRLEGGGLLAEFPRVESYVARGEARPAFQRAFKAQRQAFEAASAEQCRQDSSKTKRS